MASSNEFTVPVGTRHSFGIELEFLVAYLPNSEPDPNETEAHLLPPLLRVDTSNYKATIEIRESIRATLKANGVPVSEANSGFATSTDLTRDKLPYRLRGKNKWNVALDGSLGETFMDKYKWQPIEIQSPALWATDESFKEIEHVTNVLTYNYRLRVNPTCGFHVHVGNGTDFFTGEAIRRLGMFLWAADPTLSRLHPPWRRVHSYSASIRYHSQLATKGTTIKDVKKEFEQWLSTDDPIAITKFSDTTREEVAFGSVERWEAYAKWRNRVQLMVLAQCASMYDSGLNEIDDEKFYKVLVASAPYFEAARFGWQYDPVAKNFSLASSVVGPILSKPRPKKEERIDWPYTIRKWQNAVELMEPDKDDDHPSFSEYNKAIQTNVGISNLFKKFGSRADSPDSQYQRNIPSPRSDISLTSSPITIPLSSSPDASKLGSSPLDPNPEPLPKSPSSDESSNDSLPKLQRCFSNLSYHHNIDFNAPCSPFPSYVDYESEEEESWPQKMRPHDVGDITALYQSEIAKYASIPDAMWDRIGWVPSILNPLPDPAGENAKNDPIFSNAYTNERSTVPKVHPITSGIEGIAKLAACDSAMAVATLLEGPFGRRLNYNFKHYSASALRDDREEGIMSVNPRTIEFREAAGTLDAKWISMWVRITTGLVRFARLASPADYLVVLDRLMEQEDRDVAIRTAKANGTYDPAYHNEDDRYDVCDLLEDIGLFSEAALLRRREQERGPPR
ncbi:hypothetical protein GL218_03434 [Daldinia childiae]|uniref:uncharacterized protein n=1 Tax=Daldinia childiae TaxID=326645 RepID=UPI001444A835|nr:uncharacterized protein GL218_03434 [Daldinia childiae]KAF3060957.1 hypothetical protein GL218_03434 [Daldinia childiae]